ncbi:hypothetical protein GF337_15485 [candidate division KSB1 bacterium]|nr:hypothetical protein [candidate division KSB1 bacterium]
MGKNKNIKYSYIASDASGKNHRGTVLGENRQAIYSMLKSRGLYPMKIKKISPFTLSFESLNLSRKISSKETVLFIMQLATMIKSGISLLISFDIISHQIKNKKFRTILKNIKADIARGENFSKACKKFPNVFPPLFSHIIRAGEESGKLELVLDRYAQFVKNNEKIASEVKSALIYPMILIILSIVVMVFLTTFIVPQFADILKSSGTELPGSTKFLLGLSGFIKHNYPLIIVAIIIAVIALLKYKKTKSGSFYFDLLKIRIPVVGKIVYKTAISRFMRTMSTLLVSGVPFLKNLNLAINIVNNKAMTKKFDFVYDNIARGKSIADQFENTGLFSPLDVQMITIGENSGRLSEMFDEIADIYDREIESSVKRLTTSLEPFVLVLVASGIGFIAVSLVSSLMKAVSSFQ